jgi:hypothetical protein
MQSIYAKAKISADEWRKFFVAAITARLMGDVDDNTAEYPILQANIRFVNAHPKEMAPIDADMAAFMQDPNAKP